MGDHMWSPKKKQRNIFVLIILSAMFIAGCTASDRTVPSSVEIAEEAKQPHRLEDRTLEGGTITDGTNLRFFTLSKNGAEEEITLTFDIYPDYESKDYVTDSHIVPRYYIHYTENPAILSFDIVGVRRFDACESFAAEAHKSEYIADIYPVPPLGDSSAGLNIIFKRNVIYEVKEYSATGKLVITFSESAEMEQYTGTVYTLRTYSDEISTAFGSLSYTLAEKNRKIKNYRLLKDKTGKWLVELGIYPTRVEAQSVLKTLPIYYDEGGHVEIPLYIEERPAWELPETKKME